MRNKTLISLLKANTDNCFVQLLRYIIVGGLSFIVDYGLLYAFTEYVGLYYLISATISFIAGLVTNYCISTHWIFRKPKLSNKAVEFVVYGLIGCVGLLLNNILMYVFTDAMQLHYMLSKLIAAALVLVWNFVGRKVILFN